MARAIKAAVNAESKAERGDAYKRRLDEIMPAITEGLNRLGIEDKWQEAERKFKAAAGARARVDREFPTEDMQAPDYDANEALWDMVVELHSDAMRALVCTKAPDGAALIRKLELLKDFHLDIEPEIVEALLSDARWLFNAANRPAAA